MAAVAIDSEPSMSGGRNVEQIMQATRDNEIEVHDTITPLINIAVEDGNGEQQNHEAAACSIDSEEETPAMYFHKDIEGSRRKNRKNDEPQRRNNRKVQLPQDFIECSKAELATAADDVAKLSSSPSSGSLQSSSTTSTGSSSRGRPRGLLLPLLPYPDGTALSDWLLVVDQDFVIIKVGDALKKKELWDQASSFFSIGRSLQETATIRRPKSCKTAVPGERWVWSQIKKHRQSQFSVNAFAPPAALPSVAVPASTQITSHGRSAAAEAARAAVLFPPADQDVVPTTSGLSSSSPPPPSALATTTAPASVTVPGAAAGRQQDETLTTTATATATGRSSGEDENREVVGSHEEHERAEAEVQVETEHLTITTTAAASLASSSARLLPPVFAFDMFFVKLFRTVSPPSPASSSSTHSSSSVDCSASKMPLVDAAVSDRKKGGHSCFEPAVGGALAPLSKVDEDPQDEARDPDGGVEGISIKNGDEAAAEERQPQSPRSNCKEEEKKGESTVVIGGIFAILPPASLYRSPVVIVPSSSSFCGVSSSSDVSIVSSDPRAPGDEDVTSSVQTAPLAVIEVGEQQQQASCLQSAGLLLHLDSNSTQDRDSSSGTGSTAGRGGAPRALSPLKSNDKVVVGVVAEGREGGGGGEEVGDEESASSSSRSFDGSRRSYQHSSGGGASSLSSNHSSSISSDSTSMVVAGVSGTFSSSSPRGGNSSGRGGASAALPGLVSSSVVRVVAGGEQLQQHASARSSPHPAPLPRIFGTASLIRYQLSVEETLQAAHARNEELSRENERLKNSLQMKSMFVRYVSHEIRTPLNTVSMGLKLLESDRDKHRDSPQPGLVEGGGGAASGCGSIDSHDSMATRRGDLQGAAEEEEYYSEAGPLMVGNRDKAAAARADRIRRALTLRSGYSSAASSMPATPLSSLSFSHSINQETSSSHLPSLYNAQHELRSSAETSQDYDGDDGKETDGAHTPIGRSLDMVVIAGREEEELLLQEVAHGQAVHTLMTTGEGEGEDLLISATVREGDGGGGEGVSLVPTVALMRKMNSAKKNTKGDRKKQEAKEKSTLAEDLKESCNIAIDILNDLLLYEKLEGGLLQLEKSDEPALFTIAEAVKIFAVQAKQANIDMQFTYNSEGFAAREFREPSVFMHADRPKICQVLRNMVSNAIKFSPAGSVVSVHVNIVKPAAAPATVATATATVKTAAKSTTAAAAQVHFLRVSVMDSGAGISPENQKKLFGNIVQFDAKKLQAGGGSGFGLYISKGIMDLHGGRIGVFSEGEGKGSTFYIDIPISKWSRNQVTSTAEASPTTSPGVVSSQVAIGEDTPPGEATAGATYHGEVAACAAGAAVPPPARSSSNSPPPFSTTNEPADGDIVVLARRSFSDSAIVDQQGTTNKLSPPYNDHRPRYSGAGRVLLERQPAAVQAIHRNDQRRLIRHRKEDGIYSGANTKVGSKASTPDRILAVSLIMIGKMKSISRFSPASVSPPNATASAAGGGIIGIGAAASSGWTSPYLSLQQGHLTTRKSAPASVLSSAVASPLATDHYDENGVDEDVEGEGGAATASLLKRLPPLKVLLVDDSLINRRMASKLLKKSSTTVLDIEEAADGQQALDKVLLSLRADKPISSSSNSVEEQEKSGKKYFVRKQLSAVPEGLSCSSLVDEQQQQLQRSEGGKIAVLPNSSSLPVGEEVEEEEEDTGNKSSNKKNSEKKEEEEVKRSSKAGEETGSPPPVYFAILMDSLMPVMDGPTATQRIREAGYTGLIVGVTGNVQPEDIEHFISCGADTVMGKPLDTDRLLLMLEDVKQKVQDRLLVAMRKDDKKKRKKVEDQRDLLLLGDSAAPIINSSGASYASSTMAVAGARLAHAPPLFTERAGGVSSNRVVVPKGGSGRSLGKKPTSSNSSSRTSSGRPSHRLTYDDDDIERALLTPSEIGATLILPSTRRRSASIHRQLGSRKQGSGRGAVVTSGQAGRRGQTAEPQHDDYFFRDLGAEKEGEEDEGGGRGRDVEVMRDPGIFFEEETRRMEDANPLMRREQPFHLTNSAPAHPSEEVGNRHYFTSIVSSLCGSFSFFASVSCCAKKDTTSNSTMAMAPRPTVPTGAGAVVAPLGSLTAGRLRGAQSSSSSGAAALLPQSTEERSQLVVDPYFQQRQQQQQGNSRPRQSPRAAAVAPEPPHTAPAAVVFNNSGDERSDGSHSHSQSQSHWGQEPQLLLQQHQQHQLQRGSARRVSPYPLFLAAAAAVAVASGGGGGGGGSGGGGSGGGGSGSRKSSAGSNSGGISGSGGAAAGAAGGLAVAPFFNRGASRIFDSRGQPTSFKNTGGGDNNNRNASNDSGRSWFRGYPKFLPSPFKREDVDDEQETDPNRSADRGGGRRREALLGPAQHSVPLIAMLGDESVLCEEEDGIIDTPAMP